MRSILGALLALLGGFVFAPASARADCNNHASGAGRHRVLGMDSLADLTIGRRAPGHGDVPPCSGPSCSKGPRVPLVPPPASSTRHHRLWCDTAAPPPELGLPDSAARLEGPPPYRLQSRTDVDRPPRLPAA
jgi:hypothetical protein